jgi:Tfp pilus assembly pilus retraction ATPase PilT
MVTTLAVGITPALEVMINTATVKKLVEENWLEKLAAAIETGTGDGMINFNQALYNLVKQGQVNELGVNHSCQLPLRARPKRTFRHYLTLQKWRPFK